MSTMGSPIGARAKLPRFAGEAVRKARLSVVPDRGADSGRGPFVVLMALILIVGVAGLLAFNTSMQQRAFTLTAMQNKADALTAQQQILQMDLAALNDPQQLATRAKAIGMVVPPNAAFVDLGTGKILGTPLAASPANGMQINPFAAIKPKELAPTPRVVKVPAKVADPKKKSGNSKNATAGQRGNAGTTAGTGKKNGTTGAANPRKSNR